MFLYIGQIIVAVTSVNIQDLDTIITCIYFSVAKQKFTYSLYVNSKKKFLSLINWKPKSFNNQIYTYFFSVRYIFCYIFLTTTKTIVHSSQITLMHFNQKVVLNDVHNLYIETLQANSTWNYLRWSINTKEYHRMKI